MAIRVLKVNDPRLDIKADRDYVAYIGCSHETTKSYTADSASNNQVVWSITTPSVRVGMHRRVEIDMTFRVKLEGNPAPREIAVQNLDIVTFGTRQYPIHSICDVINYRLNDQATSYEAANVIHALLNYGNTDEDRQYYMGSSPHKPDVTSSYVLGGNSAGTRNPFSTYFNSGTEDGRNLRFWVESDDRDGAVPSKATFFTIRCIESLMISPFYWGKTDYSCLFGIQHFDLTLTLANIKRIVAGVVNEAFRQAVPVGGGPGEQPDGAFLFDQLNSNFNSLVVDVDPNSTQKLHVTFLTPQPNVEVPRL